MKMSFLFWMLLAGIVMTGAASCSDDGKQDDVKKPDVVTPTDSTDTQKPDQPDQPGLSATQGWPANYGGVMLQAFYWDSFDDSQWTVLEQQVEELAGTFDLVWLPQSGNCGGQSMGYDDLYWFENYNSSFGTEQQLRQLIATLGQKGIKTLADVVVNHRKNLSTWVDFPRETYRGVTYEMTAADICANDDGGETKKWATQNGFQLSANNDSGEGWGGMRDLDHHSANVQTIVKAYLDFLLHDLGYAGFRYDMVKGYSATFTAQYNSSSKPEFSVGECWDGSSTIANWINGTKIDGQPSSAAFDFQFRYVVRNAMNNGNYSRLSQQNDGHWPLVYSNFSAGDYRRYAVTFVENHDTEQRSNAVQDPLRRDTLAANAFMLAMPGTPCVFLKHWQAYPAEIKSMVAARKTAGITNQSTYTNLASQSTHYANNIEGRLLVVVGNVSAYESSLNATQWAKVLQGHHYAYYLPRSMNTAYASLPSGTYEGQQQVRLSALTTADGAQLAYTTDGSQPTAGSPSVPTGYTLTLPLGTTTLRVGLLVDGKVSGIVEHTYNIKEREADRPVDIPSFCTVGDGETCAFFEAPSTWTQTVMCWAWTDNAANYTGGTWPGTACTQLGAAANGNAVWKWTYSGQSGSRPQKIIFSNNGNPQTADLLFENGGYYTKDGLKGNVQNR